MNVPQDELNEWRRLSDRLRVLACQVHARARIGHSRHMADLAEALRVHALCLVNRLDQAGADRPPELPPPPDVPLPLLDSPANRRYAEALRDALEAGRQVDLERGWGEDGPAELLDMILADVETEIYGPVGRGER